MITQLQAKEAEIHSHRPGFIDVFPRFMSKDVLTFFWIWSKKAEQINRKIVKMTVLILNKGRNLYLSWIIHIKWLCPQKVFKMPLPLSSLQSTHISLGMLVRQQEPTGQQEHKGSPIKGVRVATPGSHSH